MRFPVLALLAIALVSASDDEEEQDEANNEADAYGGEGVKSEDEESAEEDARSPSAVYIMEHCFMAGDEPKWLPRGTLLLSGAAGRGFEARLSDAKEFVELRPELQPMMDEAASGSQYYAIRTYSPENPKRVLQASIPAKLLANHFEDWHDILEVTVGTSGVPLGLGYRIRNTLGLALFDHTQVHITEPSRSEGPFVNPPVGAPKGAAGGGSGKGGEEQAPPTSFLRQYWWVILIAMVLFSNLGGGDPPASGGKASGGGGGGGRSKS